MKKVAVISDTHNVLRTQIKAMAGECDALFHAGDFVNESILDELRPLTSVWAVRGNNDRDWRYPLQASLTFEYAGLRFFMTHDQHNIARNLDGVDVVIFGHSHRYFEEIIDGRLWLNPGSCGRPRFGGPLSAAILTIFEAGEPVRDGCRIHTSASGLHYTIDKINIAASP